MTDYTDARAMYFPANEYDPDRIPDSWQVQAGEYADEPDLVIVVEHAVDSEGRDVRESTARRIAALLAWPPYVSDSPLMDSQTARPDGPPDPPPPPPGRPVA